MDGLYAGNAGAIAGSWSRDGLYAESAGAPGTCGHFPHPCGSEMQVQFLTAMDGVNAENAGAIFGRHVHQPRDGLYRKCSSIFRLMAMDGRYAGNAGAIAGSWSRDGLSAGPQVLRGRHMHQP